MKSVVVFLMVLATSTPATADGQRPSDARMEYGWRVRALDGRLVSLADYRGRVLVLNVWATWCPPCVAELASLQAAADSLAGGDVAFLLLSPEPRGRVASFARRRAPRLPIVVEHDPIPRRLAIRGLPTTYVAARDGRLALVRHGAARWDTPPVLAALRALAAEPATEPVP